MADVLHGQKPDAQPAHKMLQQLAASPNRYHDLGTELEEDTPASALLGAPNLNSNGFG